LNGIPSSLKTENLPDMLEYKDALQLILSSAKLMPLEKVELRNSLKRVLATDVVYNTDMPPFNKSAMDGFACRQSDLSNELEVVETINAGKLREKSIGENQCYKIMTGAVVPQEADFVFKKEDAEITESGKVICKKPSSHNNICYRGEDIQKGQIVLNKTTLLAPRHLPVLAGAGFSNPNVYSQPAITVFATGTELVEPAEQPKYFQIRNSNSSQLLAQISEMGIKANYGGIINDEKEHLQQKLQTALNSNDVVICTGGVSVGEFDLIPDILDSLGYEILVRSTGIKPGKPMSFARKDGKYCFGLSGNPVSSFVQFELYVKPFLYAMMGHNFEQKILTFPLGKELNRKNADRINFMPANVNEKMEVTPVEFHGSAHINALSGASYLLEVPKGVKTIKKGKEVNVRPI
jgi:molybdopterin molybdotransferase